MADLDRICDTLLSQRSLILASNRGPVEHYVAPDGRAEARRGSGGIVTALNSLAQTAQFTWIASAMGEGDRLIAGSSQGSSYRSPLPGHKIDLRYVVTPRRVYHKYYNVLCNPLLWFLQHYMWNPPYNPNVDASVHDAWQGGYVPVNQAFARAVVDQAQSNEMPPVVIGHDYHLYLLPEMVRQEIPDALIQHFIHIPWPTPRYWQMIPSYITRQICSSLVCADIVGFQTTQDRQSFLDTVEEFVPGAKVDRNQHSIQREDLTTYVKLYPLSINVGEVQRISNSPRALEHEEKLMSVRGGNTTIVRIDRAEPNKNVVRGFRAFELLLSRHPELKGKINFLAFLVPSRTHIRQYQRYMEEINQLVAKINETFGTEDWQPITTFMENNYTQAIAGMKLYDVLLVNTLMEGMNLVAKEGPVVNTRDGVLVLSETSGAFEQLAEGALPVSPTDVEGTMEALYQAINMDPEERKRRASLLAESVNREDINDWICRQLKDISSLPQLHPQENVID
ncbi:Alpha,alpha-trehalose-phosphate synthase [UDP-forming] A [Geodia barretti]|uniref:Alpha,alpha-trehalose-phosphate synthase [UDP-forming] A n=1 Tax=Geodia barretti TaxID=519541 RepID=A0AA35QYC3_GEOBA|nr:Alpha,alpha-trehalose-phosphate synthase [UDP-forming] A [Geodia barretti]